MRRPGRPHLFVRVPNDIGHVELQMACQNPVVGPYPFVATIYDPASNVWRRCLSWKVAPESGAGKRE